MATTYCSVEDVADYLRIPITATTVPNKTQIEKIIRRKEDELDRRIGHAYFMTKDENSGETEIIKKIEDLQMAFATDIIPVLRDHFYDQEDILMDVLGNEFLDWENDQDLKEDWQEDKEIFKEILKKAFGV